MLCGSLWLLFRCPKCRNILNHHFSKIMLECFWYRVALPRIPIVLRWSERVLQTVATQLSNHRIHSLNVIFMHFFVVELCFRGHFPKFVSLYEIIVIKIGKNLLYLLCSIKAYPVYLYTPSEENAAKTPHNELLPHLLWCWYLASGAGELRGGNQFILGNV